MSLVRFGLTVNTVWPCALGLAARLRDFRFRKRDAHHPPHLLGQLLLQLKAAREAKGLSLAEVTELTGMDRSAISKLENGQRPNPTVDTLVRYYAEAVGKRLVVSLADE